MNDKAERLNRLRERAEEMLNTLDVMPDITHENADDLIHELRVYHTELELQLEDLQHTHAQLREAHGRYTSLFNFAPVGYVVTDALGRIVETNLAARVLFGIRHDNVQGTPLGEFVHIAERDALHLHLQQALHTEGPQHVELRVYGADNTIFFARLTTQQHTDGTPTLRTAIMDISAIKRAQEAMAQALQQQRQLNAIQQRVLSVISHEFRTPLAAIISAVDVLDRYGDRLPEAKRLARLASIRNLAWYINDLVQDVRVIAESDDDLPPLRPTSFALLPFVSGIVNDLAGINGDGRQVTVAAPSVPEDAVVTWDQHLLRRILQNLISNALKYSEDNITCALRLTDTTVQVQIIDRGKGIPPGDLPHIFEPFYRGQNAEFIRGTGIGLYVAERAVTAHGGTITCEAAGDVGTTFTVTLPRQVAARA